jgi:hypothetical protein
MKFGGGGDGVVGSLLILELFSSLVRQIQWQVWLMNKCS